MSGATEIDPAVVQKRLLARREELLRLAEVTADARRPIELDQTRLGRLSRMDAMQAQAMSVETDRRRRVELQRIAAALGRIDDGDYGFCLGCGEAIALKRLEVDPTIPICIDCAKASGG